MLPQKLRINSRYFNEVFSRGRFLAGSGFSGKVLTTDERQKPSRFACVVTKKALKRAVDRNRLRRRVYAALAGLQSNIKPGLALIIFIKPELLTASFTELKTQLIKWLTRHNLYHD